MEKDTLRMQFLSGVITENEYKVKLNENVAVAEVRRAMEAAIAKIKNPTDIERRINNVKFVVYNSLDPNTNGGERPPSDFQFDDAWWDSTHSQATDSVIASIYGELDAAVKGKSFGEDPMNENKSLNESMIGGIVGIGAINQIPPRAKADYETAFEYFLGGKYGLNEVEEVNEGEQTIRSKSIKDYILSQIKLYPMYSAQLKSFESNIKNNQNLTEKEAKDLLSRIHSLLMDNGVKLEQPSVNSSYPGEAASGSVAPAVLAEAPNLDVYGYETKYFEICPGAQKTFTEIVSLPNDEEYIGMTRSAAVVADAIFKIENDVLEAKKATPQQLKEAILLVQDYKDIIHEIDEEHGIVSDVSYMDGHIKTIESFL